MRHFLSFARLFSHDTSAVQAGNVAAASEVASPVSGASEGASSSATHAPRSIRTRWPYRLFTGVFFVFLFVLPFFTLPSGSGLSAPLDKLTLFNGVALLLLFGGTILGLIYGIAAIPKSGIFFAGIGLVLAFFISAMFAPETAEGMVGFVGEVGTVSSIALLTVLLYISTLLFQRMHAILVFFGGMLLASIVGAALVFFGSVLAGTEGAFLFGGTQNAAATLFAASALLAALTIDLLPLRQHYRIAAWVAYLILLVMAALASSVAILALFGVLAAIAFVYVCTFVRHVRGKTQRFPAALVVAFVVAVCAGVFHGTLQPAAEHLFGERQQHESARWTHTGAMLHAVYTEYPVFGVGPHRFDAAWDRYRPAEVNTTASWSEVRQHAAGTLPTFLVTTGGLGAIAFFVFLGMLLWRGGSSMFSRLGVRERYVTVTAFLLAVFFFAAASVTVVNIVVLVFAFVCTGAFIALCVRNGTARIRVFRATGNPRSGFFIVLFFAVAFIGVSGMVYAFTHKTIAAAYARQSAHATTIVDAQNIMRTALTWDTHPRMYQQFARLHFSRAREILSNGDIENETVRERFRTNAQNAITYANDARNVDPTDHENWLLLGRIYHEYYRLGLRDGYARAKQYYQEAFERNPLHPRITYRLAQLEMQAQNFDAARDHLLRARELKPDYAPAVFLLAQVETQRGDLQKAIDAAERAAALAPDAADAYFQLGVLNYRARDYQGAVDALTKAIDREPKYANAKYFLGLSYHHLGKTTQSIMQFQDVRRLNPNNAEVERVLANLKQGRAPFAHKAGTSTQATATSTQRMRSPTDEGVLPDDG